MSDRPVIEASHLTKRYGDVRAAQDLSLKVGPGEIYGFLGLNGAGKTTTIRMLLGMVRPSAGNVSLFGAEVQPGQRSIWRRVGYLVETPHAYPDLTVQENLEIVRRLRKIAKPEAVEEIMEQLGLTLYARRRARNLSLGNAQRLGLAKALIHHPDLVILDEPANALDPAGIVEIRKLLRALAERDGVTVFISSHILSEVSQLATRIGIVHEGRLVKEFDSATLAEQGQRRLVVDVRDGEAAISVLAHAGFAATSGGENTFTLSDKEAVQYPDKIATLLVRAGCPPVRLVIEQSDLESYFLQTVGVKERQR